MRHRPLDMRNPGAVEAATGASENFNLTVDILDTTQKKCKNQVPIPFGVIADQLVASIGRRCIANALSSGDIESANGIRESFGATWPEVIGVDDAEAAA